MVDFVFYDIFKTFILTQMFDNIEIKYRVS
jgi:hypothetical protein